MREFVSSLKTCRVKLGMLKITVTPRKSLLPVRIPKTPRTQQNASCYLLQIGGFELLGIDPLSTVAHEQCSTIYAKSTGLLYLRSNDTPNDTIPGPQKIT